MKKPCVFLQFFFSGAAVTSLLAALVLGTVFKSGSAAFSAGVIHPAGSFLTEELEEFHKNPEHRLTFARFQSLDALDNDDHHWVFSNGSFTTGYTPAFSYQPADDTVIPSAIPLAVSQRAPPFSS